MKCHKISHSFSCSHLSFNRRHSVCCIPKEHIFIYEYLIPLLSNPFINSRLIFCLFCRLNAFSASHEYVFAAKTVSQTNFLIAHRAFYAFMFLSFSNITHELRFKEMGRKKCYQEYAYVAVQWRLKKAVKFFISNLSKEIPNTLRKFNQQIVV